ncbi:MAG: hemolysin family protein, partial [Micromonosporaceae bacterium]
SNRLLRRVGIEPAEELPYGATPEDLEKIFAESRAGGHLDDDTSRLLEQGLDFRTRTAGEVMIPRVDVITVPADAPASRVVELLDEGHARFPVVGEDIDDIIGVVTLTEVRDVPPGERGTTAVAAIAPPPLYVPESTPVPQVLERLRGEHRQLAVVVDEFGGFAGVITLEDIAEELVGDIRDEDDLPHDTADPQPGGAWLVPARWRLDEIADATGITLPPADVYDTVSGLILQRLGRVPVPGDVIEVDLVPGPTADETFHTRHARLTVVSVRRHVPHTVRIVTSPTTEAAR